ncbi:MAG TPA: hypothetical protein VGC09_10540 [Rhodopila sp.]
MKVLIIPEDFRKDQYILKPLFDRLFSVLMWPNTKVVVCMNPLLQGVTEALNSTRLTEIFERYPMVDIFVLCVDRDGNERRRQRLDELERKFGGARQFLAVNAWEELETWVLAGLDLPKGWVWADIRRETSVKERYFDQLARQRGVADGPGGGRKTLGQEAASSLDAIRQKCREDFDDVAERLRAIPMLAG